ncbi:protein kinase [Streptomyces sp. NPDC048566]|uniref:protein kinase domain-containing protein n=1 Tax=Streptomyces sp. NPDC048566 TaxID=3365569 RepID=UPI00371909A5
MGEVFAGRYELVDPIGRGGVGAVWRAWDHRRRRYVAAKVLQQSDAHALLRFVREQALRIDHPHVLAPASWAADDDKVLFTMDLVAGGSLVHLVNDYGPLPPDFVLTLLDQLLAGLAAVHAEGVVHRDVKPANVLLEATGTGRPRLRLSDFGIAMRLGEPRLTETDYVVGTPGYLAPEQLLGSEPDFPADLFAAGLVALYLLEGAKPDAKALIEYFAEHGTPPAPRGIPEPLWQVVAALLQPDPDARFRTATGARKALAAAAELLPGPGPDDELVEVFDQLGPLPRGFGPQGPLEKGSPAVPPGGNPAAVHSPGHPDSTAAHLGPSPRESARRSAGGATGGTEHEPPDSGPDTPTGTGPGSHNDTDDGTAGGGPAFRSNPPLPHPAADGSVSDGVPVRPDPDSGAAPHLGGGRTADAHPAPSQRVPGPRPGTRGAADSAPASSTPSTAMSETGSFHLPPPRPSGTNAAPAPSPYEGGAQLPHPHAADRSGERPPEVHRTAGEPPSPAPRVSAPLPPLAPPSASQQVPASPRPAPPAARRPDPRAVPAPQDPPTPTAPYTSRSAQAPYTRVAPPAGRRRGGRARPRPGPPARVAMSMLVLALACFAVGFWALSRI